MDHVDRRVFVVCFWLIVALALLMLLGFGATWVIMDWLQA